MFHPFCFSFLICFLISHFDMHPSIHPVIHASVYLFVHSSVHAVIHPLMSSHIQTFNHALYTRSLPLRSDTFSTEQLTEEVFH